MYTDIYTYIQVPSYFTEWFRVQGLSTWFRNYLDEELFGLKDHSSYGVIERPRSGAWAPRCASKDALNPNASGVIDVKVIK